MQNRLKNIIESTINHHRNVDVIDYDVIQELWSGYGILYRVFLKGDIKSIIIKCIDLSDQKSHPRGWSTNISHQRKLQSYKVETNWYKNWNEQCEQLIRTPKCCFIEEESGIIVIGLEDLDEAGYKLRRDGLSINETKLCLKWLADFHAKFMQQSYKKDLWTVGTYWHLATRPDEFDKMIDGWLKGNAQNLDEVLSSCKYKTIVHGDAKVANFCFDENMSDVAAVDFQYVGGGCGMKDVIYLFSSCLSENELFNNEEELLEFYFSELEKNISSKINFNELKTEWTNMYAIAWADFIRFLLGWAPNHYKINSYSLSQIEKARKII